MKKKKNGKSVLVIGAGVAGLQAANDLARLEFLVYLVERSPSVSGRMAQLDKNFPTNDCSMCILAPKMIECLSYPNVKLLTCAQVEDLAGKINGFKAKIRQRPRYIDAETCTGCGDCATACPVEMPNEFEMGLSKRKAVYKPFPQALPNIFSITKPGIPPCKDSCPAHINVQACVQLVKLGKFDEALEIIHETMPFAGILGRICPHPCEENCKRGEVEDPVAICSLNRAVYDFGNHQSLVLADEKVQAKLARKPVAVIGAGPAGLTAAYNLSRKGYPVTVFEKLPVTGGMLRVGIPVYRLPREILEKEVNIVRSLGVTIKTSSPVKGAAGIKNLFRKGFKAVFIATGTHKSLKLNIAGEELEGVVHALDLLRRVSLQQEVAIGKKAVVAGCGYAAIDAARTLLRLGVTKVIILCSCTRSEMTANAQAVVAAIEEGIRLEFLAEPVGITGNNNRVTGIKVRRMKPGGPESSGRRRPVFVKGSDFILKCDMVIPAVGQAADIDFSGKNLKIKTTSRGTITADEKTAATNLKGIFAGGDATSGPATAVEAVAAGNRAAESIHLFLEGKTGRKESKKSAVVQPEDADLLKVERIKRLAIPEISLKIRKKTFREVEKGFSRQEAAREAERCLNCAGCCECLECDRVCEAGSVQHNQQDRILNLNIDAVIVATGFNSMDISALKEYGEGKIINVVTGLEFERLLSASGPTGGHVLRLSDSAVPKKIAFIQCVGSRDIRNHSYCSTVCCMYATKGAILANEHDREVKSTIFYTDLRAGGKTFQEYVARAKNEYSVSYIRSKPGLLEEIEETKNVRVVYEDTNERIKKEDIFDMVVLCQALVPAASKELTNLLGIDLNSSGFIKIPDPLNTPVDTSRPGVLAAGFAQGPGDIPESVVQATAAAGRVAELLGE